MALLILERDAHRIIEVEHLCDQHVSLDVGMGFGVGSLILHHEEEAIGIAVENGERGRHHAGEPGRALGGPRQVTGGEQSQQSRYAIGVQLFEFRGRFNVGVPLHGPSAQIDFRALEDPAAATQQDVHRQLRHLLHNVHQLTAAGDV